MDNRFKKQVVMWAIHAMNLEDQLNLEDGMWKLYYSLANEEIENLINDLREDGLVLIKSARTGNRIYPTLVLSDEGELLLNREMQHIESFSKQDLDIDELDGVLNGIIAFLNIDGKSLKGHLNLFNIISDLTISPYESQYLIKYLNMYGDILKMCHHSHYLDMFINENKKNLREFLGMLPEVEAAIFRYYYGIYDLFYRDIIDIMEYYDLDCTGVELYRENILNKYRSFEWYDKCTWIRRIVDCFFRYSIDVKTQVSNR